MRAASGWPPWVAPRADVWIAASLRDEHDVEVSVAEVLLAAKWRIVVAWDRFLVMMPLPAVLHTSPTEIQLEGRYSAGVTKLTLDLAVEMARLEVDKQTVLHLFLNSAETEGLWGCKPLPDLPYCETFVDSWAYDEWW